MFIKIVCVSLLFVTYCAYGDALSVGLIISKTQENLKPQYTEQEAQERQPLFIQAEKHEQYFITTRAQCLQAGDCDTSQEFNEARHYVLYSIHQLKIYLGKLEQQTHNTRNTSKKVEANAIKTRLTELIESVQ